MEEKVQGGLLAFFPFNLEHFMNGGGLKVHCKKI